MSERPVVNLPTVEEAAVAGLLADLEGRTAFDSLLAHLQELTAAFRAAQPLIPVACNWLYHVTSQPLAVSFLVSDLDASGARAVEAAEAIRGTLLRQYQAITTTGGDDGTQ
jgi:hypothetical protein